MREFSDLIGMTFIAWQRGEKVKCYNLPCGKEAFKRLILKKKVKQLHLNDERILGFDMNGKWVRMSIVRIRNALKTFKWEGQTIKFEMNDIYCVTKGWGGQICEFITLEWKGKS